MLSYFDYCLFKNSIIQNLKKSFSKSFFAPAVNLLSVLMYSFNHTSLLNWITLGAFLVLIRGLLLF